MDIIVPTIAILLNLGAIKSIITFYSDDFIVGEVIPSDTLQQGINFGSTIFLIDRHRKTITRFSPDLSSGFTEEIPTNPHTAKWEVLLHRKNRELTIIEEVASESEQSLLKIRLSEEIDNGACTHPSEQYYLLYEIDLPPNIASLCGIPTHTFKLPERYSNYRYIFRQWIEDRSEGNDNIKEHSTTTTTIIDQPTAKYSLEELRSIPIITKEEFYSRAAKEE